MNHKILSSLFILITATLTSFSQVEKLYLIHTTHTDYGYTNHPDVVIDLHIKYVDIAIDAATQSEHFAWTAEANDIVYEWWKEATPEKRQKLISVIQAGKFEVSAMPFNQTQLYNKDQWKTLMNWIPDSLWKTCNPKTAVQNDVNGFPRAGAMALLDKDVKYLWMGINNAYGNPLFEPPYAFWWEMPDKRKMLVWQGIHYNWGYYFFNHWNLRKGFGNSDILDGIPLEGDIFLTDSTTMKQSEQFCQHKLKKHTDNGYPYKIMAISFTNRYNTDNDPPYPWLSEFVEKWNTMGLKPELVLSTPAQFLQELEKVYSKKIPVHRGDWPDWWAHGFAASPREVAASRQTHRNITTANSILFNKLTLSEKEHANRIQKDICMYYEHTQGGKYTLSRPYSYQVIGQDAAKKNLVYKALAQSEIFLLQRMHKLRKYQKDGFYVVNTNKYPWTGWVEIPYVLFKRNKINSVHGYNDHPVETYDEKYYFWIDGFKGKQFFTFSEDTAYYEHGPVPDIQVNEQNWPVSIEWDTNFKIPVEYNCQFSSRELQVENTDRINTINKIMHADEEKRLQLSNELFKTIDASGFSEASVTHTPFTTIYTQSFTHPDLNNAKRTIEICHTQHKLTYRIEFDRISSFKAVQYHVEFLMPLKNVLPVISNGGVSFIPFQDQLPGSCNDHYAFDGWVHYPGDNVEWLLFSKDAAMVKFGNLPGIGNKNTTPENPSLIKILVYDNYWHTNFPANETGKMQFEFTQSVENTIDDSITINDLFISNINPPKVVLDYTQKQHEIIRKYLYRE
jgi:hypothetical protein